jgi:hypothetical protein
MDTRATVAVSSTDHNVDRPLPPLPNPSNDGPNAAEITGVSSSEINMGVAIVRHNDSETRSRASSRSNGSNSQDIENLDRPGKPVGEPPRFSQLGEASNIPSRYRSRGSSSISGNPRPSILQSQNDNAGTMMNPNHRESFPTPRSRSSSSVQAAIISQTPAESISSLHRHESSRHSSQIFSDELNQIAVQAQHSDRDENSEVLVPRWQPDAEVTLCPICRTQFSKLSYFML